MLIVHHIGRPTTIPGWPTNDLAGLFDALGRWPLETRLDGSTSPELEPHPRRAPYRGPARLFAGKQWRASRSDGTPGYVYLGGAPAYPDAPDAVTYCGNFEAYSFAWSLSTDDPELIARLDAAIADNIARRDAPEGPSA